jgi:hypothetical protein
MTKLEYIEIRIVELTARMIEAEKFCVNDSMHVECRLLSAQIDALVGEHLKIKRDDLEQKLDEDNEKHMKEYGW